MVEKQKIISDILSGKRSVAQAQKDLDTISLEDADNIFKTYGLLSQMDAYREHHDFCMEEIPPVSREEITDIWKHTVRQRTPGRENVLKKMLKKIDSGNRHSAYRRRAAVLAFAFLMILFFSPMILENITGKHPEDKGIKGEKTGDNAFIEYAVVTGEGGLVRPDRDLTEEDTIAFRLTFQTDGYGSLYFLHNDRIEKIFAGRYFKKGFHDIDIGYQLKGNAGENRIVLAHSFEPLDIEENDLQRLMLVLSKNSVSSMTIGENLVTLSYETFDVKN